MWPTATATTPASASPSTARKASSTPRSGEAAAPSAARQATPRPTAITRVRPTRSASAETGSTVRASTPVVIETVKLATVAPTPNARPMSGSIACVV